MYERHGAKREILEEWRIHNSELHARYVLDDIINVIKSMQFQLAVLYDYNPCGCMIIERGVYRVLVDRLEGKQPIGR